MGYDVHITRAEFWCENEGREITQSEWQSAIAQDSELRVDRSQGANFAIWTAHPQGADVWIDWSEGNVYTKNPDEHIIQKMVELARRLNARTQGDDGEWYPQEPVIGRRPSFADRTACLLCLAGSIVAPTVLYGVFAVDE